MFADKLNELVLGVARWAKPNIHMGGMKFLEKIEGKIIT
jgi:hypothetical protein